MFGHAMNAVISLDAGRSGLNELMALAKHPNVAKALRAFDALVLRPPQSPPATDAELRDGLAALQFELNVARVAEFETGEKWQTSTTL